MAERIEEGYEERGVSEEEAERRAWATVNRQTGGGNKPGGSGRQGGHERREYDTRRTEPRREEGVGNATPGR